MEDGGAAKRSAENGEDGKEPAPKKLCPLVPNEEKTIIYSLCNLHPGVLQESLKCFSDSDVDLKHIESRPSQSVPDLFDFFVTTSSSHSSVEAAVALLLESENTVSVTVLDDNPDTDNPTWFPRRIQDLDLFVHRIKDAGSDLHSDHPGFHDPVYRERRKYFADIAFEYRHGNPIPRVEYTDAEISTWRTIFTKLTSLYPTHACAEFQRVFPLMQEHCGYTVDSLPQLEDVSNFLHSCTGFRLRPCAGLLSSRDFLAGLAFRVFHSTQYIRHGSNPFYTPEPDICHELLGHAPLFADKKFAEFSQEIGLASLGATEEDIQRLATCYWFTIEFGLCMQNGQKKAYGAGLLSSFGELEYCMSDKPKVLPFDPAVTGVQPYPICEYQPVYFMAESFDEARKQLREYAHTLQRPMQVRYNPYTERVDVLDSTEHLKNLAGEIQSDLSVLVSVLQTR